MWRYQRDNQNPYIEEEQTKQWPKEKVQKDKQRSTKHSHKTKDRVTRTPIKTGGKLRCSRKGKQFLLHWWHQHKKGKICCGNNDRVTRTPLKTEGELKAAILLNKVHRRQRQSSYTILRMNHILNKYCWFI